MKNTAIIPAVIASVFLLQCANPVTPTGGEKDVSAPKIVLTNPANKSTRTKPKTVLFKFDENIQTNNIKEQLIVSPAPVIKPKVSAGKNYVVVELADNALSENTTYSVQLNESVKDLNEGNPGVYPPLLFSTGEVVDTLTITGNCLFIDEPKISKLKIQGLGANTKRTVANKALKFTLPGLSNDSVWILAFNDLNGNEEWNLGEEAGLIRSKPQDSVSIVLYNTAAKKVGLIKYSDNNYGCYGKDLPEEGINNLITFKDTLIGDSVALFSYLQKLDTSQFFVSKKAEIKKAHFSSFWKKPAFIKDSIQELYFIANTPLNTPDKSIYYIDRKQQKNEVNTVLAEKNTIRILFKNNQTGSIRIPYQFTPLNGNSILDTLKTTIPVYTALTLSNQYSFDIYTCITNKNTSDNYRTYIRPGENIRLWVLSGDHDVFYYHDKNKNKRLDGPDIQNKIPGEFFVRLPVLKIKENLAVDLDLKPTDKP
jgi:hypothetical protein